MDEKELIEKASRLNRIAKDIRDEGNCMSIHLGWELDIVIEALAQYIDNLEGVK